MNKKWRFIIAAAPLWVAFFPPVSEAQELSAEGEKVVQELVDQWEARFRSTDIATAMSNLGMEPDDGLRLAVGEHLRANTGLARYLRNWGANNVILSTVEKRIAKYLIGVYEETGAMPALEAISEAIGLAAEDTTARLDFMTKAGLLEQSGPEGLGYSLAEGFASWGGPLRYNFHSVAVQGEKPFGVW